MNTQVEVKARSVDPRDVARQGHEEAAGFVGMPLIDREHFDSQKPVPVAESPDVVIGRSAVIVPEK
jgi:hypothetical protein